MRDFARYVILSPVMSAVAAPAMGQAIPPTRSGNPSCESDDADQQGAFGLGGRRLPSKGERLGPAILRAHADS